MPNTHRPRDAIELSKNVADTHGYYGVLKVRSSLDLELGERYGPIT